MENKSDFVKEIDFKIATKIQIMFENEISFLNKRIKENEETTDADVVGKINSYYKERLKEFQCLLEGIKDSELKLRKDAS